MGELYKLNKDELIKLVINLRETISTEDLKKELKRRECLEEVIQIKKALLNLKVVPHLTKFVEKYETCIKNMKSMKDVMQNSAFKIDIQNLSIFAGEKRRKLCSDMRNKKSWVTADKINYCPCKSCNNFEILIYKNGKVREVETVLSNGWGTTHDSHFINSVCPECRNN